MHALSCGKYSNFAAFHPFIVAFQCALLILSLILYDPWDLRNFGSSPAKGSVQGDLAHCRRDSRPSFGPARD